MTEKSREIFSDGAKLREKLAIYLQTPEKVELYAQAAEAMFKRGNGEKIEFVATWSWWAFFCYALFFIYRKRYLAAFLFFLSVFVPIVNVVVFIYACIGAKYLVIKDFEKRLDLAQDNDHALVRGTNMVACVVICVIFGTLFWFLVSAFWTLLLALLAFV